MKLKQKCHLNLNFFTIMLILFSLSISHSRKIHSSKTNEIEIKNFDYASSFLDKINQVSRLNFTSYSRLSIDNKKIKILSNDKENTKILFEDIIIGDKNFAFIYNSHDLQKLDFPKITIYRTRKLRLIIQSVVKKYNRNSTNCVYLLTKNFEFAQNFPKSQVNLDLNAFCFENNLNTKLFAIGLKDQYRKFITQRDNVLKLNYLERSKVNHLKIKSVTLSHLNNHNGNADDTSFLQFSTFTYNKEGVIITSAEKVITNNK